VNSTVEKILLEYDPLPENILPALKKTSAVFGYISKAQSSLIADYFSVPLSKIYETATFYDLINTTKQADVIIQVCSSVNCASASSFEIISEIENTLRIKAEDDFNPKIKLETVSCLGRCGSGPIMIVNGKVYERVTKNSVHHILKEYL
jgi:NADH-quinone oxidoreductase subunit E